MNDTNGPLGGEQTPPLRIQIGSGGHRQHGWVNLEQQDVDVRNSLPFPDEVVDALYLEHVINQVNAGEAWRFFQEAWRVLRPGGAMRITFPCVAKLMASASSEYLALTRRNRWGDGSLTGAIASLIFENNQHSLWSRESMEAVLHALGFMTLVRPVGMSDREEFRNIECHGHVVGWWNNVVSTVIIEATKPVGSAILSGRESGLNDSFGELLVLCWPGSPDSDAAEKHYRERGVTCRIVRERTRNRAQSAALRLIADGEQEAGLVVEAGLVLRPGYLAMLDAALNAAGDEWLALLLHREGASGDRTSSVHAECPVGCSPHWRAYAVKASAAKWLSDEWARAQGAPCWSPPIGEGRLFACLPDAVEWQPHWPTAAERRKADAWGVAASALMDVDEFDVIKAENLRQEHPLPDSARREAFMGGQVDSRVRQWLNPSCMLHRGRRWMTYRSECQPMWRWSRVNLVEMASPDTPMPGTDRLLELPTRFGEWGAEDPRFFTAEGDLWICYTDGWGIGVARLGEDGVVVRSGLFPAGSDLQQREHREKNWGFFSTEFGTFTVYWNCPHVVYDVDLNAWTLGRRYESPWNPPVETGELHGGSNIVEHDGLLWRVLHSRRRSLYDSGRPAYQLWMMAFDPHPPFTPRRFSRQPILIAAPEVNTGNALVPVDVVFCGGLERELAGWRIWFGDNDLRLRTGLVPDALLNAVMSDVKTP